MRRALSVLTLALLAAACGARADTAPRAVSVGVSVSDLGNRYFQRIARAIDHEARVQVGGDVRVDVVSSAYDVDRQIKQIDRFVAAGVDMILLSAATFDGVTPAIKRARAAGIPVIAIDVRADGVNAAVTTDNYRAGVIACDYLARELAGRGQVVIINGPPVSSILSRVQGCLDELKKNPEIELISKQQNGGGSVEGGFEKMTRLLTAHPDLDGVFTINDPTALGAEQAARQAGRTDFIIVSVDGAPAALRQLREPDSLLVATAAQFPDRIAKQAVELGLRLMKGDRLEKALWLIQPELLTADNPQPADGQ